MSSTILIELVDGVEGPSLYLNQHRIAGPKPWGGGKVRLSWNLSESEVEDLRKQIKKVRLPRKTKSA